MLSHEAAPHSNIGIHSFLLSTGPRRFVVSLTLSLFLVLGFFGFHLVLEHDEWKKKEAEYSRWKSGQEEHCELWFAEAQVEVQAMEKRGCSVKDADNRIGCAWEYFRGQDEIAKNIGCPTWYIDGEGFPILFRPHDPGSLVEYTLRSNEPSSNRLKELIISLVTLTALLFVLTDVSRRMLMDRHEGWRRLTIVISVLTALATFSYWLLEEGNFKEALVLAPCALIVSILALVYGRAIFLWVAAGFSGNVPQLPSMPLIPIPTRRVSAEMSNLTSESYAGTDPIGIEDQKHIPFTLASFWPRFWARGIDLPLCWLIASIFAEFLPELSSWAEGPSGLLLAKLAYMAVFCLIIFIYEAWFISTLGATPGKMLFGLLVHSTGNKVPSRRQSKRRAWIYLMSGLYFAFLFPTLQILGAIMAWSRRNGEQPWDVSAQTSIKQKPISFIRFCSAALLALSLVIFMIGAQSILKETSREEISRLILG